MRKILATLIFIGGGLWANTSCPNANTDCIIDENTTTQIKPNNNLNTLTINSNVTIKAEKTIEIDNKTLNTITNYGTLDATARNKNAIDVNGASPQLHTINNYGYINGVISTAANMQNTTITITNHGTITGGLDIMGNSKTTIIDNRGVIYLKTTTSGNDKPAHINNAANKLHIKNYAITINEDQNTFNSFSGYDKNTANTNYDTSHLTITAKEVSIYKDSKLILSFGEKFELNKDYSLKMLITNKDGGQQNITYVGDTASLNTEQLYSHLTTKSPLYVLLRNGDSFQVGLDTDKSVVTRSVKYNIQSVNKLFIASNDMIYNTNNATKAKTIPRMQNPRVDTPTNNNINDRRSKRRARSIASLNADSSVESKLESSTLDSSLESSKFYFVFSPFAGYNSISDSDISGLDYGFISAFNARLGSYNTLGLHIGFSYGNFKDNLSNKIDTTSLMAGLHYKLHLPYDMFLKFRGDYFGFYNSLNMQEDSTKLDNMGFGGSAYYGKDFNLEYGKISLELGVDYKGIMVNPVSLENERYDKVLLHLLYTDLALGYHNTFSLGFMLDTRLGAKVNTLKDINARLYFNNINQVDFTITNDRFLGYGNLSLGYTLKDMMEFSLSYIGIFGDKSMSNNGFFNFKIWW